ncbi:non-structural protein 3 [Penaeus monodon metallodensovirus]|uniref:non-structural protein 3 n=1 Tax=Penaeus monodon metallodensovirus TaxID=2672571 RepID=UPI0024820957|nr:non-structural protein 3 [Penaeus monodon metallodensovirus]QGX07566.1 non-structural protein 3 [Penaeus monodon metallodensovirus]
MGYMTIISSETVGSILKGNLDRASIPYMYVKHNEGTKGPHRHWIIWHNDIKDQTSAKSFGHRIRMNLIRSFERAGLFKVNKDHFQIRFYNKDVKDWLIYVKHEEDQVRMELYGENGDWLEFWNSITKEQSTEKKRKSQDEKKEYIKKWKRDDRIKDVQFLMQLILQYDIRQISDMTSLPTKEYMIYICMPNQEKIAQLAFELLERHRLMFERQSIHGEDWCWWQIGMVSLMKQLEINEKEHIKRGDINYLKCGTELLEMIFKRNKIDIEDFMDKSTFSREDKVVQDSTVVLEDSTTPSPQDE